jgi:hypothetical protein
MFLSVVILGRFTTETHAMALYIGTDTPHTHLHHVTGRNPGRGRSRRDAALARRSRCRPAGPSNRAILGEDVRNEAPPPVTHSECMRSV